MKTHREKLEGWPAPCGLCKGAGAHFSSKVAARCLLSSLEQSVLIGGIPCTNASLFRSSVSAGKTGTVILRAEMLNWITAIGDRIRTSGRGRRELLPAEAQTRAHIAGANAGTDNDTIARLYRLHNRRRISPGRDPTVIWHRAGGERDQRK